MAGRSIPRRLEKLEARRRFLDWFVRRRFYESLTEQELRIFALSGRLPDPMPNRPSRMDRLDRKSLYRLWREHERTFGVRTQEELAYFTTNGFWPEQKGGFHYSMQDGKLIIEWRNEALRAENK
jgi:hypothetical protein